VKKSISVVIPNYNGAHLLEKNLPSVLKALSKSQADYEIIVPDDCSKDTSIEFLKKNYPQVITLESKVNLGFSGNINRGLRVAKKDLVLVLNSDVSLTEEYFEPHLKYFEDKNVFGVTSAIYDSDTRKIVHSDLFPSQSLSGFIRARPVENYNFEYSIPICFMSGANTLVRRDMLTDLDFFNELYSPYYGEDMDLGFRAFRKGWHTIYDPSIICYHEGSSTIKKHSTKNKIKIISRRNKYIFHEYHLAGFQKAAFHFKLLLDFCFRWLVMDHKFYISFFKFLKLRDKVIQSKRSATYELSTPMALKKIGKMTKERVESLSSPH
jgi:GT2 family glycosyltransferase